MSKTLSQTRLKDFFFQCTRKSFQELGLNDPAIIDYVASILSTFAHGDRFYRFRTPQGHRLDSVVEMVRESAPLPDSPQPPIRHEREIRKYVGDYTLFMSGLFRAYVQKCGVLDYYFQEGSRSYWKVSELDLSLYETGFLLFQELSKNFEFYSGALDYMRQAYFVTGPAEDPFGAFLKQIEGWIQVNLSRN